jgi:holdfast attachment protein HfaA
MSIISRTARALALRIHRTHAFGTAVADPGLNSTNGIHPAMSFKRKGPGILVSAALGALAGVALVGGAVALLAMPSYAQTSSAAQVSGEFERPFGYGYGEEQSGYDANTRDANGNRVILDGRIMTGMDQSSLSMSSASAGSWAQATAGAGFGGITTGTAIGNQLNVITQGNWNTVIVNSTQTNNGNQSTVLNGKIDLQ